MELFSTEWWNKVNGKPGKPKAERRLDKEYGPRYPSLRCDKSKAGAIGEAIRRLQRVELCGARKPEIDLRSTVVNTCGTDNTAAGEDERYRLWVDVTLPMIRLVREKFGDSQPAIEPSPVKKPQPRKPAVRRRKLAEAA